MAKFEIGDPVELSAKGRRYLKRRSSYGWVIGINGLPAIKVKFKEGLGEAEWWDPSWFTKSDGRRLTGLDNAQD